MSQQAEAGPKQGVQEGYEAPEAARPRWLSPGLELALYGALLLVAALMRLWDLGARAIHHDESLHALYSWYLYSGGNYTHDPMMHGPFQFQGTAFIYFLFGDSDATARVLAALFGTALVALPFFLRNRLGHVGALLTAVLLAFSPTLLYFSRFARNDIYMAVWTMGLVIAMWKYLDTRQHRYGYLAAALLAMLFATKETSYIVVVTLGGFLFVMAAGDLVAWVRGHLKAANASPPARLLILMLTLALPLGAAGVSVIDDGLGLTLANPDYTQGPIGLPVGLGAGLVAAASVLVLVWVSAMLGHHWWRGRWWLGAAIFWGIWLVLYTTWFTNLSGVGSGLWQSLGYWLVQQDLDRDSLPWYYSVSALLLPLVITLGGSVYYGVRGAVSSRFLVFSGLLMFVLYTIAAELTCPVGCGRGTQPWYYFFVITPVYEFLPLVVALIGGVYYARRGDLFTRFLVFWVLVTASFYTIGSEKMPWLLVNIALPMIVLAGKFLGDAAMAVPWGRVLARGGWAVIPLVPAFFLFGIRLALLPPGPGGAPSVGTVLLLSLLVALVVTAVGYLAFGLGRGPVLRVALLSLAGFLFLFTVRAGWIATYRNGDTPVEMLVYTQTSPDIPRIARQIAELRQRKGDELLVTVDSTDGYSWPWAWYLRDTPGVGYPCLSADAGCGGMKAAPEDDVVLLAARNESLAVGKMEGFTRIEGYKHRWWFPEKYRGVTPAKLFQGLTSRDTWRTLLNYWLYRKMSEPPASSDGVLYYSNEVMDLLSP